MRIRTSSRFKYGQSIIIKLTSLSQSNSEEKYRFEIDVGSIDVPFKSNHGVTLYNSIVGK